MLKKALGLPLRYRRGSVSVCKHMDTFLSRARQQAVLGLFQHPPNLTRQIQSLLMLSRRACLSALAAAAHAAPVPKMQAVPMPGFQVSLERSGREVTRYRCNPELRRPFLFPVIGPSGRPVTRMGHPHDPEGHSHHNSVWISHHDVNGITFWGDNAPGRIVHQRRFVIKSREAHYPPVAGVAGATILGDGKVALILDVDSLVADNFAHHGSALAA